MILGDKEIQKLVNAGKIKFLDVTKALINPASLNVRLGYTFLVPKRRLFGYTLGDKILYKKHVLNKDDAFCLKPGQFALAATMEYFDIPATLAAYVQGRSSIGRAGLTVQNAGYVDPGFYGTITLELKNETRNKIYLKPGYPVAQMIFETVTDVETPYHGKYNGQIDATESRMMLDKI